MPQTSLQYLLPCKCTSVSEFLTCCCLWHHPQGQVLPSLSRKGSQVAGDGGDGGGGFTLYLCQYLWGYKPYEYIASSKMQIKLKRESEVLSK